MIKHATADTYILHRGKIALVHHPIFDCWVTPGGHVESEENPAECALREVQEETGLHVVLLSPSGPRLSIPNVCEVPVPWFIREQIIPADNHLREPHVHVDYQYVAVAKSPSGEGSHTWAWFGTDILPRLNAFGDICPTATSLIERYSRASARLIS